MSKVHPNEDSPSENSPQYKDTLGKKQEIINHLSTVTEGEKLSKSLNYDDVLLLLGEFGKYQRFQYFLVALVSITSVFHSMNMVFVGPTPDHRCTAEGIPSQWSNLSEDHRIKLTYPYNDGEIDKCQIYNLSDVDWTQGDYYVWINLTRSQHKCNNGWHYSDEYYRSTIVSEWNLVCDKSWARGVGSSIFFAGRLVGALVVGQLCDQFGRRPVFFIGLIVQVVVGCIAAASPALPMFYVFYFLQGAVQVVVYLASYVLGTELVGPSYRKLAGTCINYFYAFGQVILVGLAYFIREWRYIELTISLAPLVFLGYYWIMPESIRWLMTKGKKEQAHAILVKSSKWNKVKLPRDILDRLNMGDSSKNQKTYTVIDILKHWSFAKVAINVWFNWLVNALVYYGLSLNTSNLSGDPYINFLIAALVEFPALTIALVLLDRIGRRKLLLLLMVLGGVACIATAFVPEGDLDWLAVTLSMTGKFAITASYSVIYLMAAEVFPTVVRTVGMGVSSMFARIGGMVAPQLLILGDAWTPLPLLTFGVLSIVAGFLALFLPEPMGKPLPQDFDDTLDTKEHQMIDLEIKHKIILDENVETKPEV